LKSSAKRVIAVRIASAAFVLLLLGAHTTGDLDQCLGQPLSLFRDGEQAPLGYLLFAALLVVALLYTRDLIRAGEEEEAVTAGLAALLLFLVAVTPSWQVFHLLSSLLLLLVLFGHYWRLLRDAGSPWLIFHSAVPFVLVVLSGCHSYGLWQKCVILYLVALANVRHYLLGRARANGPLAASAPQLSGSGRVKGRRRVYQLEAGREWARHKAR
jgi:hypothetical protein